MKRAFLSLASVVLAATSFNASTFACDGYRVVRTQTISVPAARYTISHRTLPVVHSATTATVQVATPKATMVKVAKPAVPAMTPQTALEVVRVDSRPLVKAGSKLQAKLLFLGDQKGYVFLKFGGVSHRCVIESWDAEQVTFSLPQLDLGSEIDAVIEVVRPDGTSIRKNEVRMAGVDRFSEVLPAPVAVTVAPPSAPESDAAAAAIPAPVTSLTALQ